MKKERQSFIKLRGGFSDSNGINPCNTEMQCTEFDEKTRTVLSNATYDLLKIVFENRHGNNQYKNHDYGVNPSNDFCVALLSNVFNERPRLKNGYGYEWTEVYKAIDAVFTEAPYNEVLDIIWFIVQWLSDNYYDLDQAIKNLFNAKFEQEYVGYRFVGDRITPITDKEEKRAIEETLEIKFKGCKSHIQKALGFLSDRDNPDYKNSIKESISAVESICQIITEDSSATLGQALKLLEDKGIVLHAALKRGFSSLYGYTSDEGGIRHAEGLFESNVTFEEAKYMLVSCCAFVNYLIAEYGKIK